MSMSRRSPSTWLALALVLVALALHFVGCFPVTHVTGEATTSTQVGFATDWQHQNEPAHCEMHSADNLAALERTGRPVDDNIHATTTGVLAPSRAEPRPWSPRTVSTPATLDGGRSVLLKTSVSRT